MKKKSSRSSITSEFWTRCCQSIHDWFDFKQTKKASAYVFITSMIHAVKNSTPIPKSCIHFKCIVMTKQNTTRYSKEKNPFLNTLLKAAKSPPWQKKIRKKSKSIEVSLKNQKNCWKISTFLKTHPTKPYFQFSFEGCKLHSLLL